jgi:hypothetical protein
VHSLRREFRGKAVEGEVLRADLQAQSPAGRVAKPLTGDDPRQPEDGRSRASGLRGLRWGVCEYWVSAPMPGLSSRPFRGAPRLRDLWGSLLLDATRRAVVFDEVRRRR